MVADLSSKTTRNAERLVVYEGAGGYVKSLRGNGQARRDPKPHQNLGDVQTLTARSRIERDETSR